MLDAHTSQVRDYFDEVAPQRERWKRRARYYHSQLTRLMRSLVPAGAHVLEVGCGHGDLVAALQPARGAGIDISPRMVALAQAKYPGLEFMVGNAEAIPTQEKFSHVILSDVIGNLSDVQKCFTSLHQVTTPESRVIITYYNQLWEWLLKLMEWWRLKMPQPEQNWLSRQDIANFLGLSGWEVVKQGSLILAPFYIPIISTLCNRYLARLPLFRRLCLVQYVVARPAPATVSHREYTVSVIIPARNEAGNVADLVSRLPKLGSRTEIIFVEGGSRDATRQAIIQAQEQYRGQKEIILVDQGEGRGKGDAVRRGFARATGDILMILDADATVRPEELSKFYQALRTRQGEFIMGSRLVYSMEDQAMRFFNVLGNKFFSLAFSWLLDQPIKDTLCGTKVLGRSDYERIAAGRRYFGYLDPFGDFDLIFGAAKLNLKILEIPIRYQARRYGTTNISRWRHGWLLLKMTLLAARKIKFI